ncbi:MAG TPA: 5-(carboxyamino)imidazole ribonucleotide mutase [Actinomycetota bacterium]|nr:5-(carboxyamino)imidazole ribonucleotide mutase [Actinomycetota bacterium]
MSVQVGIVFGSPSDRDKMAPAGVVLEKFGIEFEMEAMSAHRQPARVHEYVTSAESRGLRVMIAGAGRAAHLPGVVASLTPLPVIGVPLSGGIMDGMDALLSVVQMPSGVPVGTVAVDAASNAGLLAVQILAAGDDDLRKKLHEYKQQLAEGLRL